MQNSRNHLLIAGSDEFSVKIQSEEAVRLAMSKKEEETDLEVIDCRVENVDAAVKQLCSAIEALQTLPIFSSSKVVHLKDATFLADSPLGRSQQVLDLLEKLAQILKTLPAESAQLILSASPADRRRSFYKSFSKIGQVEVFDKIDLTKTRDLEIWLDEVEQRIEAAGLQPQPGVVERLVELAGNDSRALQNEIEKLRLFTHPHGKVTEEDVRGICSGTRAMVVWDLCDAVTQGKTSTALQQLRKLLAQGESDVGLLILLGNHIRLAALGKYLLETKRLTLVPKGNFTAVNLRKDAESLLPKNKKGEKPNPYRMGRIVQQTGKKESARWFRTIEILHSAHGRLFSPGVDRNQAFEDTVLQLCMA